jgi:hypothetical protein
VEKVSKGDMSDTVLFLVDVNDGQKPSSIQVQVVVPANVGATAAKAGGASLLGIPSKTLFWLIPMLVTIAFD